MANNVWSTGFMGQPSIPAPNVRTNGGRVVHAGCFARASYWGLATGPFKVAASCHESTPQCWTFTATSDPVSCSRCLTRLRRAGLRRAGVTQPVSVTRVQFRLAVELEDRVLIPYSVPRLRPPAGWPRLDWPEKVRELHSDLIDFVRAATPANAQAVSDVIGWGVTELAALFAELDDGGHQAAA
jgi:hypothetical protein